MSAGKILLALEVLGELTLLATEISVMIQKAQTEGRDITEEELDVLQARRFALVADLHQEIARRHAEQQRG